MYSPRSEKWLKKNTNALFSKKGSETLETVCFLLDCLSPQFVCFQNSSASILIQKKERGNLSIVEQGFCEKMDSVIYGKPLQDVSHQTYLEL